MSALSGVHCDRKQRGGQRFARDINPDDLQC
jgi:hypothetical protein